MKISLNIIELNYKIKLKKLLRLSLFYDKIHMKKIIKKSVKSCLLNK